ncbi:MAG: peptidase M3, partial [Muribaculaceae bacterium]|nr:peptidase M3 [Muribaculaceae bacterium]
MKPSHLIMAAGAVGAASLLAACSSGVKKTDNSDNPLLQAYATQYEIPPFEQVKPEHYVPALAEGIKAQRAEIEEITSNAATPTFENTMLPLDRSGALVDKTMMLFGALDEAMSTPELVEVAAEIYPMHQQWSDEMSMNPQLFERVKYLYDHRDEMELTPPPR